jgi:hypothetical protein
LVFFHFGNYFLNVGIKLFPASLFIYVINSLKIYPVTYNRNWEDEIFGPRK